MISGLASRKDVSGQHVLICYNMSDQKTALKVSVIVVVTAAIPSATFSFVVVVVSASVAVVIT
jgi:hypothetical protein